MTVPPTTSTAICNLALARLGQSSIASVDTPVGSAANTCALHYDMTLRALLREFMPNFARKRGVWTADGTYTPPVFGFQTGYALPSDFLRLMRLGDIDLLSGDTPGKFYDFDQNRLITDMGNAPGGGVQVQYVALVKDATKFDALFVKCFYLQLAMDMAYAFTLSKSLIAQLKDDLKDVRQAMAAVASQEKPPVRVQRSRLRDVRRSGGIFKDNTRI